MENRCPVWIHPGTEREGTRCVLQVGHSGEHKTELVLSVDPGRENWRDCTGIFVRAKEEDGAWDSVDIAMLKKESLLAWLRSREGLAERTVLTLLGYPRD